MGAVATRETIEPSSRAVGRVTPPSVESSNRRRFTIAVVVGLAVVAIPYLWVLWDLWSPGPSGLRGASPDFFYDLQARAMFHGHLFLPNGALGIEAFVHDGRQYTYFGIFPSLIRMPVLIFTSRLDGRLTAPSMLLAWMVTGLYSSFLLWRLRILIRGQALLGRAEAASYGLFVAGIGGGSVIVYLSATPFVFNEDFAWSVALTVASLFALLGVLEEPSRRRVLLAGAWIVATNLNRTPTGYACVIGAGLIAVWFGLGRGGADRKRWALPMATVAVAAFGINCLVTYAKFGTPVGLPMADQVWAHYNAHRRYFLAANGGKAFSFAFLPSTIIAYLQPFGIHLTGVFPYITMPTAPAAIYGGVVLDQWYPTASIPPTMPLLFLLSCWGAVVSFLPRPAGRMALTRIPLVAAAAGTGGVLLWGYISNRYMADFMPLLILAGAIGLIDVWRRLAGRSVALRRAVFGAIAVLAAFSIVANMAIAIGPSDVFSESQLNQFLDTANSLSVQSLASTVRRGATLPYWAPAGQIYIVGDCSGLYYSTGETYKNVPGQQLIHWTWMPVEQGAGTIHTIDVTFNEPQRDVNPPVPIFTYGKSTLYVDQAPEETIQVQVTDAGAQGISFPLTTGGGLPILHDHTTYQFMVVTDPNMKVIEVWEGGSMLIGHYLPGPGRATVLATPKTGATPPIEITDIPVHAPLSLCHSLLKHG
jgi:hypothetical protein